MSWDQLFPEGRVVFYEGDDPTTFAREMRELYGIDVAAPAPAGFPYQPTWLEAESFFIPAGLVEAVYGSGRWELGS